MRGIASARSWAVVSALLAVLAAAVAWSLATSAPQTRATAARPSTPVSVSSPVQAPTPAAGAVSGPSTLVTAEHEQGAAVAEWHLPEAGASSSGLLTNPKSKPLQLPADQSRDNGEYQAAPLQPLDVPGEQPAGTGAPLEGLSPIQPTRPEVDVLIRKYFPAEQVDNARRISMCESGQRNVTSRPNTDGTRDHGIFQINDGGTFQELARRLGSDPSNIALALNPDWNVMAAAELFRDRGWQPWTCARKVGLL